MKIQAETEFKEGMILVILGLLSIILAATGIMEKYTTVFLALGAASLVVGAIMLFVVIGFSKWHYQR